MVESNEIRFNGFRKLFKDYPQDQVDELVEYAKANGGVSRYKKIEFFFNAIRNESIDSESVNHWANKFSKLVTQDVLEANPVKGSLEFLKKYFNQFDFAIVSGSDQKELREVCKGRGIDSFFKIILGSPRRKKIISPHCYLTLNGNAVNACMLVILITTWKQPKKTI